MLFNTNKPQFNDLYYLRRLADEFIEAIRGCAEDNIDIVQRYADLYDIAQNLLEETQLLCVDEVGDTEE